MNLGGQKMKLKLIGILVILISIMSFNVFADCIDTDGGEDYYTIGEAYTDLENVEGAKDCCKLEFSDIMGDPVNHIGPGGGPCFYEGPYLYEAICDEKGLPSHKVYKCPDGCRDGKCINRDNILSENAKEVTVDGKIVKLENVGSGGSIIISVDLRETKIIEEIPASATKTINGLEITNIKAWYEDVKAERSALVKIKGRTETKEVKLKVIVTSSTETRNKIFLKVDESITINGKKVTLVNVGSGGSIVVNVDGTLETIPAKITETINGIEITNLEINYRDTKSERSAVLGFGNEGPSEEVTETTTTIGGTTQQFSVSCGKTGETTMDLIKYPEPFLLNGQLNKIKIVVGKNAPTSDTLAATDIATRLQYDAKGKININPVLDSEITNPENYNLILIGQPKNNNLIQKYATITTGTRAQLELSPNGDNVALIVSGATDLEVRNAAKILSNYEDYGLKGDKCKIIYEREEEYVPTKPLRHGCIVNGICEPKYGENEANCPKDCEEIRIPLQCNGCMKDGSCLDFGMRIIDNNIAKYCNIDKTFHPQKEANEVCQNNFECNSNLCINNECVSAGLWKKVMNWFARIFGYVVKS